MKAGRKREIKEGTEYDHLFPKPEGRNVKIATNAGVEETLKLMRRKLPEASVEVAKIARLLKGKNVRATCANTWHFVYEHIQYTPDTVGVEEVRSPKRTWHDRKAGVDCDCYSMFIGAVLANLGIPFVWRIAKYPKEPPEIPAWQHIYPVVPLKKDWNREDRDDYITVDCVKDGFDEEQPYLEQKDYDMRLEYLEGIDHHEPLSYHPGLVDAEDVAGYDDEMGNLFNKIKKGVSQAAKSVQKTVQHQARNVQKIAQHQQRNIKTIAQHQQRNIKTIAAHQQRNIKKIAAHQARNISDKAGTVIRAVNRFANPATIALRNGFLLAMKKNMFNVAGRLKWAYLSDSEAAKKGMDKSALAALRKVKDKAETIYWQAGGLKTNLKSAILAGEGNKNKEVPVSGLNGFDGLEGEYADQDEYNILHTNSVDGLGELGEAATAAIIAAASGAVATLAAIISQIKGLFGGSKGKGNPTNSQQSNGSGPVSPEPNSPEAESNAETSSNVMAPAAYIPTNEMPWTPAAGNQAESPTSAYTENTREMETTAMPETSTALVPYRAQADASSRNENAASVTARQEAPVTESITAQDTVPVPAAPDTQPTIAKEGLMDKVKKNPWPYLLGTGLVLGGGYMLLKKNKNPQGGGGLNGVGRGKKKPKGKARSEPKRGKLNKEKVQSINLRS